MRKEDYYYVERNKEKIALVGCHNLLICYHLLCQWVSYGGLFLRNVYLPD
jgi:hypothetical protein